MTLNKTSVSSTARATWTSRLILAVALGSLIFEQSPANEALRTALGLGVLDSTNNELLVGAAVAALTMIIEGVSSLLIALGLHSRVRTVERLTERFRSTATGARSTEPNVRSHARNALTNTGLALGVGAGLVVMRYYLLQSGRTLRQDIRVALWASVVVAVISGFIGVLAAGGIEHADKVGLGTPARFFVDYATDWRFWLALFAVIQAVSLLRRLADRSAPSDAPPT